MFGMARENKGRGTLEQRVYCPLISGDGLENCDARDSSTDSIFLCLKWCSEASLTTSKINSKWNEDQIDPIKGGLPKTQTYENEMWANYQWKNLTTEMLVEGKGNMEWMGSKKRKL